MYYGRRKPDAGLTRLERIGGIALFLAFYPLNPLIGKAIRTAAERLLEFRVTDGLYFIIYYYVFFALTVIVFQRLLAKGTRRFLDDPRLSLKTAAIGLVAYYGLVELAARLITPLFTLPENRNDAAAAALMDSAPHMIMFAVIFLGPFVEETLFRGLVFGGLKERNRGLAYGVSCILFALVHVWQFAAGTRDPAYLLMVVQYLAPGLVLAWVYEHTGTLWASILLHVCVNALAVLGGLA